MRFPILPILLLMAFSLTGCAHDRGFIPPGEDADALVAAIASKGQGEPQYVVDDPPHRNVVGPVLTTGVKVGETTAVIGAVAGLMAAQSAGHGSVSSDGGQGIVNGVANTLHNIWSDD